MATDGRTQLLMSSPAESDESRRILRATSRRIQRARRKQAADATESQKIADEVERLVRVEDGETDLKAIMGEGWGIDHGYTGVSFSSPVRAGEEALPKNRAQKKTHNKKSVSELAAEEAQLLDKITAAYNRLKTIRKGAGEDEEEQLSNERAVFVSYHLPFSLARGEERWLAVPREDVGLGVGAVERMNFQWTWVGWPGGEIDGPDQGAFRNELLEKNDFAPVFLKSKLEALCSDYCHRILQPTLYSNMLTTDIQMETHDPDMESVETLLEEEMWTSYTAVMQQFADVVKETYEDGDVIWVDGFHLMYLPKLLKQVLPEATIGFSLHAPFPTSEIFRILPKREELLNGLLSCDLIGLQSLGHVRHLTSTCLRILGCSFTPRQINYNEQVVNINIFPLGVNLKAVTAIQRRASVKARALELRRIFEGKFVFLSVARPDRDGGIMHGLFGFEEFCGTAKYRKLAEKAVFVQVAILNGDNEHSVHGRDFQIERSIGRVAGRINGAHANMKGPHGPLYYLQNVLGACEDELYALYEVADCVVTTPLRGGMEMVPAQYIVCRNNKGLASTVIISEFISSAEGLGGAIRVNPFDTQAVSRALARAMLMEPKDVRRTSAHLLSHVNRFTSHRYLQQFSEELFALSTKWSAPVYMRKLESLEVFPVSTHHRLVILDFEGVLVEQQSLAELEVLDEGVLASLRRLGQEARTSLMVHSYHTREWMDSCLEGVRCTIVAEGGFYLRWEGETEWLRQNSPRIYGQGTQWADNFRPIFEYFTKRTPGSCILETDNTMVWQYQDTDPEHGERNSLSLTSALLEYIAGSRVKVERRANCVELRRYGASKAAVVQQFIQRMAKERKGTKPGVLCILDGESKGDRNVFKYLKRSVDVGGDSDVANGTRTGEKSERVNSSILCTVKIKANEANYYVDVGAVRELLQAL